MKVSDLYNRHEGKTCFIFGAGPSLHYQDVDFIRDKDFVSITVNSGILKAPWCKYWITDDYDACNWTYFTEEVLNSNCVCLLYKRKMVNAMLAIGQNRIVWFDHKFWWDGEKYHEDGLVLTKDPNKPIIGARTSVGSAIHFAYIMGCKTTILLGCDCCYKKGCRYFWQLPGEKRPKRTKRQMSRTIIKKDKKGNQIDNHCDDFMRYWRDLSKQLEKQEIIVYNASGGILPYFKKVKLEDFRMS